MNVENRDSRIILRETPKYFFQYPVITEEHCISMQTREDEIFIHMPWATIIDRHIASESGYSELRQAIAKAKERYPDKVLATAVQHISFMQLMPLLTKLGVERVYAAHKRRRQCSVLKLTNKVIQHTIRLFGMPLYPVNVWDKQRSTGITEIPYEKRKYMFSFVGAAKRNDLNPIRFKLLSKQWSNNKSLSSKYLLSNTTDWHFGKIVYGQQVKGNPLSAAERTKVQRQTEKYNRVLCDTKFSLCPVGSGPNTIRLWESICVGAVPIIIANEFHMQDYLPKHIKASDICVELPYNHKALQNATNLYQYLKTIDGEKMSSKCFEFAHQLKENGWFI